MPAEFAARVRETGLFRPPYLAGSWLPKMRRAVWILAASAALPLTLCIAKHTWIYAPGTRFGLGASITMAATGVATWRGLRGGTRAAAVLWCVLGSPLFTFAAAFVALLVDRWDDWAGVGETVVEWQLLHPLPALLLGGAAAAGCVIQLEGDRAASHEGADRAAIGSGVWLTAFAVTCALVAALASSSWWGVFEMLADPAARVVDGTRDAPAKMMAVIVASCAAAGGAMVVALGAVRIARRRQWYTRVERGAASDFVVEALAGTESDAALPLFAVPRASCDGAVVPKTEAASYRAGAAPALALALVRRSSSEAPRLR